MVISDRIIDGATVTPVDDYTIWLRCAELKPSDYANLTAVIADTTAMETLCNNLNALRYMVRSEDVIMPAVLAVSSWITALDSSTYSIKVPTMTGYTTPSGEVTASGYYGAYLPWWAFDGNDATGWSLFGLTAPQYVQYQFVTPLILYKLYALFYSSTYAPRSFKISYSDNGTDWTDIETFANSAASSTKYFSNVVTAHKYLRFTVLTLGTSGTEIETMQFYGLDLS